MYDYDIKETIMSLYYDILDYCAMFDNESTPEIVAGKIETTLKEYYKI